MKLESEIKSWLKYLVGSKPYSSALPFGHFYISTARAQDRIYKEQVSYPWFLQLIIVALSTVSTSSLSPVFADLRHPKFIKRIDSVKKLWFLRHLILHGVWCMGRETCWSDKVFILYLEVFFVKSPSSRTQSPWAIQFLIMKRNARRNVRDAVCLVTFSFDDSNIDDDDCSIADLSSPHIRYYIRDSSSQTSWTFLEVVKKTSKLPITYHTTKARRRLRRATETAFLSFSRPFETCKRQWDCPELRQNTVFMHKQWISGPWKSRLADGRCRLG